jgi:hypothetical protein
MKIHFLRSINALILALCFFGTLPGWTAEHRYQIDGKWVDFIEDPRNHTLVTKSCGASSGNPCAAIGKAKQASQKGIDDISVGGANPGALICKDKLGGTNVLGFDKFNNEQSFCKFSDQSMVDNGSILYFALENDKRAKSR